MATKPKPGQILSIQIIGWSMLVSHLIFVGLSLRYSFFPGYDALMGVVGTMAEIIAGLYGITMASYTFFLSRIDGLCAVDTTLDHIVESLKRRFKQLIWFITGNVLCVLLISLVLMYCPEPTEADHVFFYRLFCNEFLLSLGYSIGLILYYAIEVINPNSLEKEARKLQRKLSPNPRGRGNVLYFLEDYHRITVLCNGTIPEAVLNRLHENKGSRFEYTLALLPKVTPQWRHLLPRLRQVHQYYECSVNCRPLTVSREMEELAEHLVKELESRESNTSPCIIKIWRRRGTSSAAGSEPSPTMATTIPTPASGPTF